MKKIKFKIINNLWKLKIKILIDTLIALTELNLENKGKNI